MPTAHLHAHTKTLILPLLSSLLCSKEASLQIAFMLKRSSRVIKSKINGHSCLRIFIALTQNVKVHCLETLQVLK